MYVASSDHMCFPFFLPATVIHATLLTLCKTHPPSRVDPRLGERGWVVQGGCFSEVFVEILELVRCCNAEKAEGFSIF